jgi:hypothetical protein
MSPTAYTVFAKTLIALGYIITWLYDSQCKYLIKYLQSFPCVESSNFFLSSHQVRVKRPVSRHLVFQRSANFWKVLLWIWWPKGNFSPTICAPTESWIVEKDEEMRQMRPSKGGGRGFKWWKLKPPQTWKTITEHSKKSLWKSLYCLYGSKIIFRS